MSAQLITDIIAFALSSAFIAGFIAIISKQINERKAQHIANKKSAKLKAKRIILTSNI